MARQARKKSESGVYHIMLRGINKKDIFIDDEDYRRFLKTLYNCKKESHFELYAFCLMSNHIHLMIKESDDSISTIIKRIGCSFVYWYNKKYDRIGHLFQDRFRSEPVEDDEYFLSVLRYIHQNPVKAGLVANCEDYPYSSFKLYFVDSVLIDKKVVFDLVSKEQFNKLHKTQLQTECIDMNDYSLRINDSSVKQLFAQLIKELGVDSFLSSTPENQSKIVAMLKQNGASIPQIVEISGLKKWKVEKYLYSKSEESN